MTTEIVVTVPLMDTVMAELAAGYTLHRLWEAPGRAEFLAEIGEPVRAIATDGAAGADAALIDALPNLEIIACCGVGIDGIDIARAREREIPVTNTPDVLTDDVADMALALLLANCRRLCAGDRFVRAGRWRDGAMALARSLGGKRVGIVGLGRIGRAVAARTAAFGCRLAYHGPRRKPDVDHEYYPDLVEMARACDFLVVTCTGGAATRGLVGRAVIDALGADGGLINVSRGSVVDQPALVEALAAGRLGSAALDVFADEPDVPEPLLTMDNVVLQPHMGSATEETRGAMGRLVIDNLAAHFAGRPLLTPV